MAEHERQMRPVSGGGKKPLFSVGCSCGWLLPDATKFPGQAWSHHISEVTTSSMKSLMNQKPRSRG